MRRFAKLLIGPALIDEFGDPEDSQDWKFLAGLSAYHVAAPGKTYPPILIATSRRDDRAHPGHAQDGGEASDYGISSVFLRTGHGWPRLGQRPFYHATITSLACGFLRRAIGWQQ
jgi:prolyl oligopeptidase